MTEKDKRINDLERKVEELEERVAIMSEGKPDVIRCKDCKYFSFMEHWADIGHGAKILVTDHCPTCDKWANGGCKTNPDGYCYLAERNINNE